LFGLDEGKASEEIQKITAADSDVVQKINSDESGFDEEVMKSLISNDTPKPAPAEAAPQDLLQLEEGMTTTRRSIDWKKWEKFVLNEFEAARITGELDEAAHKLAPIAAPIAQNLLETDEGFDSLGSGLQVDKMCGCEIALSPVCGSDGATYPSKCFAECAGLPISHDGPCLSKSELEKPDSFKVMSLAPSVGKLKDQMLIAVSEIAPSIGSMFSSDMDTMPVAQEPGVDFATLPRSDALSSAREEQNQNLLQLGREINMPFSRPITQKQFNVNVDELSRIATQFEPALRNEKLAKCECRGSYSPVCGLDHSTYPSACYASCVGMGLKHIGPCHDDELAVANPTTNTGSLQKGDVAATVDEARDPLCFCSLKEKSVCGIDGVTYTNRCFADCVHVKVRSDGPCYTVRA